jgi:hypothetical protein
LNSRFWGLRPRLYAAARFAGSAQTTPNHRCRIEFAILGLAPQALCCRPLRGLGADYAKSSLPH